MHIQWWPRWEDRHAGAVGNQHHASSRNQQLTWGGNDLLEKCCLWLWIFQLLEENTDILLHNTRLAQIRPCGIFQGNFRRYMENKNIMLSPMQRCCLYFNRKQPVTEKVKWFWSFETKPKRMPLTLTRLQSAFIDYFHFLSLDTHCNSCWLRFQGKLQVLSLFLCFFFFFPF